MVSKNLICGQLQANGELLKGWVVQLGEWRWQRSLDSMTLLYSRSLRIRGHFVAVLESLQGDLRKEMLPRVYFVVGGTLTQFQSPTEMGRSEGT